MEPDAGGVDVGSQDMGPDPVGSAPASTVDLFCNVVRTAASPDVQVRQSSVEDIYASAPDPINGVGEYLVRAGQTSTVAFRLHISRPANASRGIQLVNASFQPGQGGAPCRSDYVEIPFIYQLETADGVYSEEFEIGMLFSDDIESETEFYIRADAFDGDIVRRQNEWLASGQPGATPDVISVFVALFRASTEEPFQIQTDLSLISPAGLPNPPFGGFTSFSGGSTP